MKSAAAAAVRFLATGEGGRQAARIRVLEARIRRRRRSLPARDVAEIFDKEVSHLSLLETTDAVFLAAREGRSSHVLGVLLGLGAALDLLELFDKQLSHRTSSPSKGSDQPEPPKATGISWGGQVFGTPTWAEIRSA